MVWLTSTTDYQVCHLFSYVLLHHVMGELDGKQGAWAFVFGGMGAVSDALAKSALSYGAEIFTEKVFAVFYIFKFATRIV